MEARLRGLEAAERARVSMSESAAGGEGAGRGHELELARDHVVAEAAEPISEEMYMNLYREWAGKYGFGPDWYVLTPVGKVESNAGPHAVPAVDVGDLWRGRQQGRQTSWTPKTPYPPPATSETVGRRRTGTGPCTHTTTPTRTQRRSSPWRRRPAHDDSVGPYV